MPRYDTLVKRFDPEPRSAAGARRFVISALDGWQRDRFGSDAALCIDELATNAILHARTGYTVSVRPISGGVRMDVLDGRPDELPVELANNTEPLTVGTTGRGLLIVANLAARWGYFNTDGAKTVWVELHDDRTPGRVPPLVSLTRGPRTADAPLACLLDIPVDAAVASGVQVDDLARAVQLSVGRLGPSSRLRFFALLDRTAAVRLTGRQAALRAAGEGHQRFNLELSVSAEDVRAMNELQQLMGALALELGFDVEPIPDDVVKMRTWVAEEVSAQLRGVAPSGYQG